MRLRPAEAVRCPAPHYTDNKMLKDVGLEMQHTLHRLRLASVCFREATDRNPADAEAWNWLANTLVNLEEHDAATQAFAAANSLQPSAAHLINQGVALQRNGRLREAMADACRREGLELLVADRSLSTDNAAMIAYVAALKLEEEGAAAASPLETDVDPNLALV